LLSSTGIDSITAGRLHVTQIAGNSHAAQQ
jgi:hypothetical protein